jgi:hypothetical protein
LGSKKRVRISAVVKAVQLIGTVIKSTAVVTGSFAAVFGYARDNVVSLSTARSAGSEAGANLCTGGEALAIDTVWGTIRIVIARDVNRAGGANSDGEFLVSSLGIAVGSKDTFGRGGNTVRSDGSPEERDAFSGIGDSGVTTSGGE